jgi:hypothetical protein
MTTTIKCKLFPIFERRLEQTLDGCRRAYCYFRNKMSSVEDMQFVLVELKESHFWLNCKILQMVVHQIDAARSALNALKSHCRKTSELQYSEERSAFTYNQSGFNIVRHGGPDLLCLSIRYAGQLRLHKTPVNFKQISVIKKPSGKWFANIVSGQKRPLMIPITDTKRCVGIDVGVC